MQIIQSKLLKPFKNLTQGFTTKKNGNLAFHVGDKKENVIKNHKQLAKELNYKLNSLVHMKQIHTKDVIVINTSHDFLHPPTCDALITNKKNIPLMVMVADCSPILFYDSKCHVIAVAHSGRAGTFKNIIATTLDSFKKNYNSSMEHIYVSVGASIGSCCYEVGKDIYREAERLGFNYATEERKEHYYLDIQKILHKQLLEGGIAQENIEFSLICNACSLSHFSYRREGETGREAGVILLK